LTLDESLEICDQFPELFVQEVNFTGGEPFLRSDWESIAMHLQKLGIKTKILTNGLTLDPITIAMMKEAGIAGVGISLDGLETTHDHIRSYSGLFNQVLQGINLVKKADFPLTVITTVNALNLRELPALFDKLQSQGVDNWQIQPIFPLGRAQETSELSLSIQEYMELERIIKQLEIQAEKVELNMNLGDSFGYFSEHHIREPPWKGCPAGLLSCGITSDGKIKGCLSMPDEITEGDLRQNDLWDIWFNSDSFAYNRQFSIEDLGPICRSCDKGEQCKGGCSAMSYGSEGRLHNDPYCFYGINNKSKIQS
jgi:radical SAM protein with 4Fe4S-binding SPASM domain